MILSFDQRPDATVDEKIRSLMESVQMAFNAIDGGTITGSISSDCVKLIKIDGSQITGEIDGNYVFVKNLDARSVIAEEGWIDKLMVQTGLLSHAGTIYELDAIQVNASSIKAGTIDVERLVVTDATTGKKHMVTWNETTQQWDAAYLDGNAIADNTLAAGKIVASSITTREITVENLVGTGGWINLRNGTFSYANATSNKGITWDGSALNIKADSILLGAADEDLTTSLSLKANKATLTSEINATADTVKIDANKLNITGVITAINGDSTTTIDGGKIRANSIEGNALKIGGVITAINNDSTTTISGGKIDATTINTSDLNATGVITAINNSTGTTKINGGKITTGSITATQIASATITADEIAGSTITAAELAAGCVTSNKIATGAITADKIDLKQSLTIGSDSEFQMQLTSSAINLRYNTGLLGTITGSPAGDYMVLKSHSGNNALYLGGGADGGVELSNGSRTIYMSDKIYLGGPVLCGYSIRGASLASDASVGATNSFYSTNAPSNDYAQTADAVWYKNSSNNWHIYRPKSSSRRYKKDIKPVANADLDPHNLYDIEVVQFKYNESSADENRDPSVVVDDVIGFIAENVYEHYPVAVNWMDGKVENWNHRYIIPPMLALIQEQNERIKALEEQLS